MDWFSARSVGDLSDGLNFYASPAGVRPAALFQTHQVLISVAIKRRLYSAPPEGPVLVLATLIRPVSNALKGLADTELKKGANRGCALTSKANDQMLQLWLATKASN